MHLADAFIQSDLHCIQVTVFFFVHLTSSCFPGNRTHDLGVASAMLYQLSYRKAVYGQDTGFTPLLFTMSVMGFLMTTESQDLGLTSHPKEQWNKRD